MTVLINIKDIHLEYPTQIVFTTATLGVNSGDRIGIVGRNGDGKSSLLAVLAKTIEPDSGEATHRSGLSIGLLSQADTLDDSLSVAQAVVGETPEHIWAAKRRTRAILDALLADVSWNAIIGNLSGGQRRRVDLARLLIEDWDVLMLDEPTNHLDLSAIRWLAQHLQERWSQNDGALLVVTHDRWFLDESCSQMWEVHDGQIDPFQGGYSAYMLARVQREQVLRTTEQKRRNCARKELAWLTRGARARATKPKFHVKAAEALIADVPPIRNSLELKRAAVSRLGKQVIDLIDASLIYNENTIINACNWIIGAGERIGILGLNGAGKTSLLRLLNGSVAPSTGRVKIGASVRFGSLSQRLSELDAYEEDYVREVLANYKASYIVDNKEVSPTKLLEHLGFERAHLQSRVKDLSGGQRRRLQLLLTLLSEPNVLILDEPGNDLDTDMLTVIEDLLDNWPGTLILVSHDRFLIERVTDSQFALIDGNLCHVPGGVDEYLRLLEASDNARKRITGTSQSSSQNADKPTTNTRELKKELASLERKLQTLEQKHETLLCTMRSTDPTDYESLIELGKQQQQLKEQTANLEERWLEISELI
ncbi:MAG: ABC-F family ATP-binding cassette domain-containing protein [Coriobacteriales bacterium]|jgi:ATPase subunit of ABC transporter with duplicated ATPase domains|nr:ABC-F family ATP-binding cassette domain-containing protein [Coriobacteriales bacterium]